MEGDFKDEFLELSDLDRAFCEEYVIDCDAAKAALRAGLIIGSHSARKAIKRKDLQDYLLYLRKHAAAFAGVTVIRNARELAKIAYGNVSNLRTSWREVKDWDELTEDEKAIIGEVHSETSTVYTKEGEPIITDKLRFKTHDKIRAIDMLNKMFDFEAAKKVELTGKDGEPINITGMVIRKE